MYPVCVSLVAEKEVFMSKLIPGNKKHLTKEDRKYIEQALNESYTFRDIGKYLCKDPTTISREVRINRREDIHHRGSFINPENFCVHRFRCKKTNACNKIILCDINCRSCMKCNRVCDRFEREQCSRIQRAPFVCNGCQTKPHMCSIQTKYYYSANSAHQMHQERLTEVRSGVSLTRSELHAIDAVVRPLIEQGQSPYMIIANHPELNISVKTLYNYIDQGVLLVRNVDLKRKVKFKKRKIHRSQITDRSVFIGRTYHDFKSSSAYESYFWEMDTVLSAKGSYKCILTLYYPPCELLLAHLMNRCTAGAVKLVFDALQKSLGGVYDFASVFETILTDRGGEFGNPDALEHGNDDFKRTTIFYCDPMRSSQKGGIENVHTMLRMILPKGTVFENLTQWDIRKCVNHINSTPRNKLGGRTPYEMALEAFDKETLDKLQLRPIPPDKVTLTPKLLS